MILTQMNGELLIVRQPDHGEQTGLFASSWGNEDITPLGDHSHSVQLAARHHDDGWALWERRPTIDHSQGRPVQFFELTPTEHIPFYRAGILRALQHDPRTGLLVSMHGAGLYNDRYGTFRLADQRFSQSEQLLVDEFLSDMAELQRDIAREMGLGIGGTAKGVSHDTLISDDPEVRYEYLLLQVWDRLSLQYAYRLAANGEIAPLPLIGGGSSTIICRNTGRFSLELDPYPFTEDAMTFPLEAIRIADRHYRSSEDFLEEIARQESVTLECVASRKRW